MNFVDFLITNTLSLFEKDQGWEEEQAPARSAFPPSDIQTVPANFLLLFETKPQASSIHLGRLHSPACNIHTPFPPSPALPQLPSSLS